MKKFGIWMIIIGLFTMIGCSSTKNEAEKLGENIKKVKVIAIQEQSYPKTISYIGNITAGEIKAYSFKTGGRIANIFVETGQKITKGDKIAALETADLVYQKDASEKQMKAAKAQYDKTLIGAQEEDIKSVELDVSLAQESYDFALTNYENALALYNDGAISKNNLDQAEIAKQQAYIRLEQAKQVLEKVKKGATEEEREAAKAQYEAAKIQYQANASLLEDATIIADIDGYVVKVQNKAGEMIGAGLPVVIVRNDKHIVQIGVTQKDVKKLRVGDGARIKIDDMMMTGEIIKINQMPDVSTKTYTVELSITEDLSNEDFYLGSTVTVDFNMGNITGIWIELLFIMNDGEDYIYVVQDGRAVRRDVQIEQLYEDKVLVKGLQQGEKIIIEGMKSVKDGYKVEAVQ